MSLIDQVRHKAVEQGQEQGTDMRPVHVRIRHDNNLVIAQPADIEIIPVSFRKTASEGVYHGLDLRVGEDLVDRGLLHVQNLATDGKNRLEGPVARRLGAAARGVSLHDEDLALLRIFRFAVRQLPVGVKGIFLLRQQVGPGLFLRTPDLRRFLGAAQHFLQLGEIPVKIAGDLVARDLCHRPGRVRVV